MGCTKTNDTQQTLINYQTTKPNLVVAGKSKAIYDRYGGASSIWPYNLEVCWLVGNETNALCLANVVESDDPDECIRVNFLHLFELSEDLGSVSASEHGKLPHYPVASIIVPGGVTVLTVNETVLHHIHQHMNKNIIKQRSIP